DHDCGHRILQWDRSFWKAFGPTGASNHEGVTLPTGTPVSGLAARSCRTSVRLITRPRTPVRCQGFFERLFAPNACPRYSGAMTQPLPPPPRQQQVLEFVD